jgi:hypothetical protein
MITEDYITVNLSLFWKGVSVLGRCERERRAEGPAFQRARSRGIREDFLDFKRESS